MHECVPHMSQHLQIPLKLVPNASPSPVLLKRFLRTDITLLRDLLNRGNEMRGSLGKPWHSTRNLLLLTTTIKNGAKHPNALDIHLGHCLVPRMRRVRSEIQPEIILIAL